MSPLMKISMVPTDGERDDRVVEDGAVPEDHHRAGVLQRGHLTQNPSQSPSQTNETDIEKGIRICIRDRERLIPHQNPVF